MRDKVFVGAPCYRGVNLLIDTSSGAACFIAPCGSCGNREIATPFATPVATPVVTTPTTY